MIIRFLDILFSSIGLLILSPLLALSCLVIKVTSKGPIFYCPTRVGKNGKDFKMFKLRTMHISKKKGNLITSSKDKRIFLFGNFLRNLKIDEIPQLINVINGEMSLVGPRAEDREIVEKFYTKKMIETLKVKPGLTSSGSLYYFRFLENKISGKDPLGFYIKKILPIKIDLDLKMIQNMSLYFYIYLIIDTVISILEKLWSKIKK